VVGCRATGDHSPRWAAEPEKINKKMKLVKLIKMCLSETYNRVRVGKYLCDMVPIQNSVKHGDALLSLLFTFTLKYSFRRIQLTEDVMSGN
jgi:hypothetical protein